MTDAVKGTLWDSLKDRLTSPLSGSFIIIWLLHNWDYPLIVFTKDFSTKDKILLLNRRVNWSDNFWIPILLTLLYVFLMPLLQQWYEGYVLYRKNKIEIIKKSLQSELRNEEELFNSTFDHSALLITIKLKLEDKINMIELLNKAVISENFDSNTLQEIQSEINSIKRMLNNVFIGNELIKRSFDDEASLMQAYEENSKKVALLNSQLRVRFLLLVMKVSKLLRL